MGKLTVSELYGRVDNMNNFTHPEYGKLGYMSTDALIQLASQLTAKIASSGYETVVVSETGACPLAYLCEKLMEGKGVNVNWVYMKFPREPMRSVRSLVMYYLQEQEKEEILSNGRKRMKRKDAIKTIDQSIPDNFYDVKKDSLQELLNKIGNEKSEIYQQNMARTLKGTRISTALNQSFLFFDEYIDSGTTLRSANHYFKFFVDKPDFKTISYYMNISGTKDSEGVYYSAFDLDSQAECFRKGAYLFENRIDLIGHFYYVSGEEYIKMHLEDVCNQFGSRKQINPSKLLGRLDEIIRKYDLVDCARQNFDIPQVKQYFSRDHLIRQYLFILEEETYGKGVWSEYLWQLADMYGPIWTPMPKDNHFDFFKGMDKTRSLLQNIPEFKAFKKLYAESRNAILTESASVCLNRRNAWLDEVNKLIGGVNNEQTKQPAPKQ